MHEIEPYDNWQKYYQSDKDLRSPFFGRDYGIYYVNDVYGYYIDPRWDEFGSETFYCKILYTDYSKRSVVIELFGEWNDTLHNDIMHFKRNVVDPLTKNGIENYILIAENIFQFHGGDTDYYEEWFEDIEEGYVALLNAREFIVEEMKKYKIDYYLNMGGSLQLDNWRTAKPAKLVDAVNALIQRRLGM